MVGEKCNEGELLERFGIDLVPLTLADLKKRFDHTLEAKAERVAEYAEEIGEKMADARFPREKLRNVAAFVHAVRDWADEENLVTAATQCWGPMFETVGISPCFALSELSALRLPVICECDIHGPISSVMGRTPTFLADVTARHPENDNAELFWHCGVFPRDLAREDQPLALIAITRKNRKSGSAKTIPNHR